MILKQKQMINDQYMVLRLIHESRTLPSEVYLVKNIFDDSAYVMKVIKKDSSIGNEASEIFNREWKSLKTLNHENVVSYYDSGETDLFYFILIDYITDSVTLEKYIVDTPNLTLLEKLKVFRQIMLGIQHAHEKEIIHRDLAPNNILVGDDENGRKVVKIIDFGISKLRTFIYEEQTTVNHYFNIVYSSPEQKSRKRVSMFSDIYSLGFLLVFMLSGRAPEQDTIMLDSQITSIDISDELKAILKKSSNVDIGSRYSSVESFLNQIDNEIDAIENQDAKLFFKLTNSVTNDLFEMNIIDFPRPEEVKRYLLDNEKDFYIYRIKNDKYHIICDLIRFICTIDKGNGTIVLIRANELESYSAQEKVISRAFQIKVEIEFSSYSSSERHRMYLFKFLEKVDYEYQDFINRKKNRETEDRLISVWSKKIKQQETLLQKKKNVGYYSGIQYDVESGYYHFMIEVIDDINDLEIGKNISLLNKKLDRLEKVGEIKRYTDEIIYISPTANFDVDNYNESGKFGIDYSDSLKVTQRAKKALETLKLGMAENKNLLDIIIDPSLGTVRPFAKNIKFANPKIDAVNRDAVISALGTQDIFLIQGPPGTGKSTVINELIYQIRKNEKDSKILLASQSHVAVDHIFNKLKKYFPEDLLVRIGNSDRISKKSEVNKIVNQTKKWTTEIKKNSINYMKTVPLNPDLKQTLINISNREYGFYTEYENIFQDSFSNEDKTLTKTVAQWYRNLDSLESFDNLLLGKASIIASTCVGVSSNKVMKNINFDWVIIDEAAKSTVPEVLIPMVKGKKIVLVGDHKQLPPIINEFDDEILSKPNKKELSESLFEDLFVLAKNTDIAITLSKQFRMHPAISYMINKVFYTDDVDITTDITPEERRINYRINKPIVWLSTERLSNNQQQKTAASSFSNSCEAEIILSEIEYLEEHNPSDSTLKVGIISAYSGQKAILEKNLKPKNKRWKNIEIIIENVDAFQGSEVDIVIYSVVRSNAEKNIGFLSEQRRLNVALSRARAQVIIVGNAAFMKESSKKEHNYFEDVLIHIERYKRVCELEVLQSGL